MKKVTFTGDVFRSHAFSLNSVAENRYWLRGLFHDLFSAAGFCMGEFGPRSEGGTFDLRRYRAYLGLPSSAEGWAAAVSTRVPDEAVELFEDLLEASLVIGWGLPPSLIDLLDRHKVSFIDVEIDPIRFAEDLFFRMRTNSPQILRVLASHDVGDEELRTSVSAIRGYAARRSYNVTQTGKSLALFAGQTTVDLAVIEAGKLAEPSDYIDTIRSVAQLADILLVKPHPAQQDYSHLTPILDQVPNAHLCRSNTYRILTDIKLKHVVGLSSSVLSEAALFQVPTTQLIKCDREASPLIPELSQRWFRVPSNIVSNDRLTRAIGSKPLLESVLDHLSPLWRPRRSKGFNLRRSLGTGWGIDEFYSGRPLSIDVPDEVAQAHCSQQIGPLELGPYLAEGWSFQEAWGTWSIGHQHKIKARLVDFDEGDCVAATLHINAFVTPEFPEQRARIYIDQGQIHELRFRWNEQEDVRITVDVPSSLVNIVIETPDAVSPAVLGLGEDERRLGIRIHSIGFSSDQSTFAEQPAESERV